MNLSDLTIVIAFAAALYGFIVALTRQRKFLTNVVNPNRGVWLFAGLSSFWFGIGILRLEAHSWSLEEFGKILLALINDAPLSSRGKMAAIAIIFGLLLISLVFWCKINLPRDPSAFKRPSDRIKAMRYYITKIPGGLDYAALIRSPNERLEEVHWESHIREMLPHLPRVKGENITRTLDDQIAYWRETAIRIHHHMEQLDTMIASSCQGTNRRLVFDCEFGGLFFIYLRPPVTGVDGTESIFLFGATLSQAAIDMKDADWHFDLLVKALKNIENGIRMQ